MFFAWILSGCEQEVRAAGVPFDPTLSRSSARTVQGALDELYVRCAQDAAPAAPAAAAPSSAEAELATRLAALELKVGGLEVAPGGRAESVSYEPGRTTLSARNLQAAMDELEARVTRLEDKDNAPGQPGAALFEMRDKHGNPVDMSAKGPPPGGGQPMQGGGQPMQGPPPNGGRPPNSGGSGGSRPGGGSGGGK